MQRYCTELTERLLKSLDKEYNVVDMGAVVDVITALEKTTITKEVLEVTRLGKYINELRRKTNNDALAKRAKDLVRRWRDMVLPSSHPMPQPTLADTAPQALNGTKPQSPALRGLKPHSPATIRTLKPHSPALKASLKPQSPLLRDSTPLKVLSPVLSLHSEKSRSPNAASTKHHQQGSLSHVALTTTTASTTNNRLNTDVTLKLSSVSTHNHTFDAVPRTHSSNKRLRKEDSSGTNSPITPPLSSALTSSSSSVTSASLNRPLVASSTNDGHVSSRFEPPIKRARLNGETSNYSNFSYTTDTSNNNVVSSRSTTNSSSSNVNVPSTPNQKVPSPREMEQTSDRLSDVISCKIEVPRDTTNAVVDTSTTPAQAPPGPKKRGRKKGSKSVKNQALPEDRVKEKLASISRNPKLKTTQELLADLQARGSTTGTNFATGSTTIGASETTTATTTTTTTTTTSAISNISNRKNEISNTDDLLRGTANDERSLLSSRFNRAKREKTNLSVEEKRKNRDNKNSGTKRAWDNSKKSDEDEDDEDEDESEDEEVYVDTARTRELTVEEILAKLPPLDRDAISWSDCDDVDGETRNDEEEYDDLTKKKREITDKDVERLHNECIEGLNGNFQSKIYDSKMEENTVIIVRNDAEIIDEIKSKSIYRRLGEKENDREFREWHEMLARPSYEGQTLHILPYVIID